MAIEEYFDPDRIRIQNLANETPEKKSEAYDPERELIEEDWKWLQEKLECAENIDKPFDFLWILARAKIVSPRRFGNIGIKSEHLEQVKQFVAPNIKKREYGECLGQIADMKIACPKGFETLGLEDNIFDDIIGWLNWNMTRGNTDTRLFVSDAADLVIAAPHKKEKIFFNESIAADIRDLLEVYRRDRETKHGLMLFETLAADCRIAFSGRFPKMTMNDSVLIEMQEEMAECRRKKEEATSFSDFFRFAADLKIITAEKVEVTGNGLEIVMSARDSLRQDSPIPEARKF